MKAVYHGVQGNSLFADVGNIDNISALQWSVVDLNFSS